MGYTIYDEICEMDLSIDDLEGLKGFIDDLIKQKRERDEELG